MGAEPILFWTFAAVTIVGGLMAVFLPRVVHAIFSLLLCFGGVAAVYVLAGADFLAVVQMVVYVGGVLVLMAFGILLTGRTAEALGKKEVKHRKVGIVLSVLLFFGLWTAIRESDAFATGGAPSGAGTSAGIGTQLLTDFVVPFEFASLLLLVAMVGAAYLVRRTER